MAVADTQVNIAIVLEIQGKFDEALELYEKALKLMIVARGHNHVAVTDTNVNIGEVFRQFISEPSGLNMLK